LVANGVAAERLFVQSFQADLENMRKTSADPRGQ
jgi:hypothetical protein